ncbi:DNA-binding transcriptional repressor XynR [Bacillaceae bacterium]
MVANQTKSKTRLNLINSVDRALRIIDLFDEHRPELKLTEISQALQLNKSTVHGLLRTLAHHGYITQNADNGRYRLGYKFLERGQIFLQSIDLRELVHPYLVKIADEYGESSHLAILDGDEAVYVDKAEGKQAIRMYSRVGKRAPIHCTALGKVLAAWQSPERLEQLADRQAYTPYTPNTITNKEEFLRELQKVRENGYALDNEEMELGLRGIAVPIFNHLNQVVAAVSVAGPVSRLDKERSIEIAKELKEKARKISQSISY